ncbi:MAG TPA: ABC transporter substrate binding protein, partial [Dehalococcoidia bacterium]|nr:ABC transporter substrate binding protein [Dehalococcoidia bacterium]
MRRREVIVLLAGSAVWPLQVRAQQALKKIGFVSWQSPAMTIRAEQFRKGLGELGYVEGKDVQIEVHFTDGSWERTKEVLGRLVQNGVDILVVSTTPAIQVAKETTRTIPIVMAPVADPIA